MVKDQINNISALKKKKHFTTLSCSATKLLLHSSKELFGPLLIGRTVTGILYNMT
jgi:hypothetical protein